MKIKYRPTIPLTVALLSITAACTLGSGTVVSETRQVADFTKIELQGSGEVQITVDGTETLVIDAEDNLIDDLTADVTGDTLVLGVARPIQPTADIVYTVTAASLDAVVVAGNGNVSVLEFSTDRFDVEVGGSGSVDVPAIVADRIGIEIDGSGSVTIAGTADDVTISVRGSGSFDGLELTASEATVRVEGSGSATVDVRDHLDIDVSGSGSVEYLGEPSKISTNVSGSGTISQR